jgi:hypothetical protein
MYERFFPPGFHAGSRGSLSPVDEDGGREDDMEDVEDLREQIDRR